MSKKKGQSVAGATYIRAKVGKRVCDCLLETGSDVTVIPASLVKRKMLKILYRLCQLLMALK